MEMKDLYSEEKIYSILRQNDSLINETLGSPQIDSTLSFTSFEKIWINALNELNSSSISSSAQKDSAATLNQTKSFSDKKLSIGIFVLMMLFGFIFAYQRKKK